MKDFNIAKYLRENHLGSHAILGRYVDLHALTEEKVPVKKTGIYGSREAAQKVADVCTTGGMKGVEVKEVGEGKFKVYADAGQEDTNESVYGNNDPVDEVPYVGAEEKLDGFGDEFDQVDPVEEMDNSITGDKRWQYDDEDFSSERDKFDRMMGLAHEYFEKVSPIVKKTIDALRADGFDDQDIVDFLATDFTMEEEVSVSSSGVEMEEVTKDEFSNVVNTLNSIAKKVKPTGAKLSFDDDSSSDAILVQVVTKDGDFKLQKAVHAEVKKLVQKANSGFKISRIEQDSPGRISFSIDKVNLESIEEAADFTKFVKVGNVYDNHHNSTGGFRMKLKVIAVDPVNQTITAVDENGRERTYSAFEFTNDYRAEDANPIDSKWTDPGYKNRD